MKWLRLLTMLAPTFIACSLYSQVISTKSAASHGTVNIFLGNSNGLVAVTDSRISSNGRPIGYGQKLFKLDDHTICSIAGFFSDAGPTFSGPSPHPLETDIAPMFNAYIEYVWRHKSGSLRDKFYALAKSWALDLDVLEKVEQIAKQPPDTSPSVLTVAGYDDGALWVGQITLNPTTIHGQPEFTLPSKPPLLKQVMGGQLTSKTAGIDSLTQTLLDDPARYAGYDPIFQIYAESEKRGGSPLTLDQLKTLANRLERMTAIKYPSVVGGIPQVAVLSRGKADLLPRVVTFPRSITNRKVVSVFRNLTLFDITITNNDPGVLMLFVNDRVHDCSVDMDRMIFANSTFYNCVFNYNGSPLVLFDGTNNISYSNLALDEGVSDDSKIVKMFKSEYPKILIVHKSLEKSK